MKDTTATVLLVLGMLLFSAAYHYIDLRFKSRANCEETQP